MDQKPLVVLITVPSKEVGFQIARTLLEKKLAACTNIIGPVNSLYTWQGEIHNDEEFLLMVKSWEALFAGQLVPAVQSIHPYEVPEILALPIADGLPAYLAWMAAVTRSAPEGYA
jgi:periplasmic divalent cation tolerance protein